MQCHQLTQVIILHWRRTTDNNQISRGGILMARNFRNTSQTSVTRERECTRKCVKKGNVRDTFSVQVRNFLKIRSTLLKLYRSSRARRQKTSAIEKLQQSLLIYLIRGYLRHHQGNNSWKSVANVRPYTDICKLCILFDDRLNNRKQNVEKLRFQISLLYLRFGVHCLKWN